MHRVSVCVCGTVPSSRRLSPRYCARTESIIGKKVGVGVVLSFSLGDFSFLPPLLSL